MKRLPLFATLAGGARVALLPEPPVPPAPPAAAGSAPVAGGGGGGGGGFFTLEDAGVLRGVPLPPSARGRFLVIQPNQTPTDPPTKP